MHGNTVVTAVTLAIEGNAAKIAYFPNGVGTAHGVPYRQASVYSQCKLFSHIRRACVVIVMITVSCKR